jgi:adenylate cyclase
MGIEIELDAPDQPFFRPEWLGEEVTGDLQYFNSNFIRADLQASDRG